MGVAVNPILRHVLPVFKIVALPIAVLACCVLSNQAVAKQASMQRIRQPSGVVIPTNLQRNSGQQRLAPVGYSFGDSPAIASTQTGSKHFRPQHARIPNARPHELSSAQAGYWQEPGSENNDVDLESSFRSEDIDDRPNSTGYDDATSNNESAQSDDNYRLPQLANVNDPINLAPLMQVRQQDPSGLLTKSAQDGLLQANQLSYAELFGKSSIQSNVRWTAPNFCHRPLLFEDVNLERYGNQTKYQNLHSAGMFFGSIPTMPYRMGRYPRCHRDYTFKHYRPGDCVPYQASRFELNPRGGFWQLLATAAVVIP